MIIWVDAQLSPALARWISEEFGMTAVSVRRLDLLNARDHEIFHAARAAGAAVLTKDADFVLLLERFGPPPPVLWVRCGNTSNAYLRDVLSRTLPRAIELVNAGEALVEITDAPR